MHFNTTETDKSIKVEKQAGEYGFRIHGSRPVIISAIESDTSAENSGLEIGDIVVAINDVDILDKTHAEVVELAKAGGDVLRLQVVKTADVVNPVSADVHGGKPLYCGYLWKLGGYASGTSSNKWVRRWFMLKSDNCLYYYKTDSDNQPVGATLLFNYNIQYTNNGISPSRKFQFELKRDGVPTLHLAADSEQASIRWIEVLTEAADKLQMADAWFENTRRNLVLAPNAVQKPDCFGYLVKIGDKWKSFNRRYCVLKDACLYFYQDINAKNAFGVACLHGYKVLPTTDRVENSFEIIPSDPNQKHFYFSTESDVDKKRWVTAIENSICRWLNAD